MLMLYATLAWACFFKGLGAKGKWMVGGPTFSSKVTLDNIQNVAPLLPPSLYQFRNLMIPVHLEAWYLAQILSYDPQGHLPSLGGSPTNQRMVTNQPKDGHPKKGSVLEFGTYTLLIKLIPGDNCHELSPTIQTVLLSWVWVVTIKVGFLCIKFSSKLEVNRLTHC